MNHLAPLQQSLETFDQEQAETTAMHLARVYQTSIFIIKECLEIIDKNTLNLHNEFSKIKGDGLRLNSGRGEFAIHRRASYGYRSSHQSDEELFKTLNQIAWRVMIDALGIKAIMATKKREEFERQLESGDLPEISEENILSIIQGLAGQAQEFAIEAAKEVFEALRPNTLHKANNTFRVGKKVILTYTVEVHYGGPGWKPLYHKEAIVNAIDSVFHLLDGKGVLKKYPGPLCEAMKHADGNSGETEYFKFRCFHNKNLHLTFKRLDLVEELNYLAVGERVLGDEQ